jgi:hypothetical protein
MSERRLRIGVGVRFIYDGELVEVIEMRSGSGGNIVLLKTVGG